MDLADQLSGIVGEAAVDASDEALRRHGCDNWPVAMKQDRTGNDAYLPEAVVSVTHEHQVSDLLRWGNSAGVPVTPWGLGSSVTGAPLAVRGGVVLDLSGLAGPIELDEQALTVTVAAGTVGLVVEHQLNERGYTLGHSPQSLGQSSVGGWLATRATGQFSSRYGGIEDLVVGFTVVLPTGEPLRLEARPRAALGPDLRLLFLGSEGTLGVFTSVTLKIFPVPSHRIVEAFALPDVQSGLAAMRMVTRAGLRPFLARLYDEDESRHQMPASDPEFTGSLLLLGHEGGREVTTAEHAEATALVADQGGRSLGAGPAERWMERRFDFTSVSDVLQTTGGYAETIEVAHTWGHIEKLYRALKAELVPLADEVLGHFSHVYQQGTSLYLILLGQAVTDVAAGERLTRIWDTAMRVSLQHGAELSHHHGAGLARQPFLEEGLGDALGLLRRVKRELDPAGILNPGKLALT